MSYYLVGKMLCPHCGKLSRVNTEASPEGSDYVLNIDKDKLEEPSDMRSEEQVLLDGFWVGTQECEHCDEDFDVNSDDEGIRVVKRK